jgi:hypothetical protein
MIALAGLLFIVVGALSAEDKPSGALKDVPGEFMIDNEGYKKNMKGPVKLNHEKHIVEYKVACTECHHEYDKAKKNVWTEGQPVKKCSECHDPNKKQGNVSKLNLAYHKNCKDCHKPLAAEGKKVPYKKCNDCHEKK